MKYFFLNDRSTKLGIHPASATEENCLEPAQQITVEIPVDAVPFVKVWDNQVLLAFVDSETADQWPE